MITQYLLSRFEKTGIAFIVIIAAMAIFVPLSNLLLPTSSPLHVPTHIMSLMGKYLCYAILAISLDLVWGYCGILSLGHGAFFALGFVIAVYNVLKGPNPEEHKP